MASESNRSSMPALLPTKPALSKSTVAEVIKALEVAHPLKASHMCALLATYPTLGKDTVILHPSYFDMAPPSTDSYVPHQPLPSNKVFLAPLQHLNPNHWSVVRIQRDVAHTTIISRHYDPIPSPHRLQDVERMMKLWAKLHHPNWDVRVSEVTGPKAATSALSGLYAVLGTDEFPANCSFAPTWGPKSPQSAVVAALERYERAASADSGVSMDEEDASKAPSSSQSSKGGAAKKGIGIGTAKRTKGSLVRKLVKEKSPVTTPKKASPLLSAKNLPPKPKVPGTPQSEQKAQLPDTPKPKAPVTPVTEQKPSFNSPKHKLPVTPQSELKQLPTNSSKLNILTNIDNKTTTLPPTPSTKRPRSETLSENPLGISESPVKKRCTPENRDTSGTIQSIGTFIQGLSFPSPEQAAADMEGSDTVMMAAKSRLQEALEEQNTCSLEYAERFKTCNQHENDWKVLAQKIAQDTKSLENWFKDMPTMNTMTSEQCEQIHKAFESNLDQHRNTLKEKHAKMESSQMLLKSAQEVWDANKIKVAELEIAFAEKEAEYREFMKRKDVAKFISEFGDKFGALKAKWET
ncbi:uncharacterized protein NECHADRAFT_84252 [Fusarium vanettenii 77-13-4]|uniref:Uncharacterized protein n=1 Tax=Fusarium vanettenii (strain ATCC MYA-4622 / CBS 123669 / FGSC 9596 / NRRL 45880 / 77-13-4) TaxID=660122 RepID=C7Z049_FUSV7|nr:uncharacterized protein NECHADRAFT_84252 [Fusarium vanettenii 77-13-4]EEU42911.1 predicted protein [Fusarium vanettenii 77-13-4]